MSKITTLLFDCDNTLVLSEELAFEGCADLLNQICELKGVPQQVPLTGPRLIAEFVGQNFRGMLLTLQQRYGFSLTPDELEDYVRREEDVVIGKLKEGLRPCAGVDDVLEKLKGKYQYAVVSSSALRRVKVSIEKVGQDKYFDADKVYSAATSLPTPTSKPDPAIYLWAIEKLGKKAGECVAVEDSKSGTLSAHRAGLKVVGYVGPYEDDKRVEMEKVLTEAGAGVIMRDWSEFEDCLAKLEG
ncbi:HAD-like domain-containing protein [Coniochaeta sp. 2T2.1]|nr:HAD-like domain-containing protein [Coniochaeta sp. 2T2.1]